MIIFFSRTLSPEKKDDLLGVHYIIYEEFLESLLRTPFIILLPINCLTYLLMKFTPKNLDFHWPNIKFIPFQKIYRMFRLAYLESSRISDLPDPNTVKTFNYFF